MSVALGETFAYANAFSAGFSAGHRAASDAPATCRIAVFDPGPQFNLGIIKRGATVKWAKNNVERASRHFQYGSEWWVHRRLASLPAATSHNTSLVCSRALCDHEGCGAPHQNSSCMSYVRARAGLRRLLLLVHAHICSAPSRPRSPYHRVGYAGPEWQAWCTAVRRAAHAPGHVRVVDQAHGSDVRGH